MRSDALLIVLMQFVRPTKAMRREKSVLANQRTQGSLVDPQLERVFTTIQRLRWHHGANLTTVSLSLRRSLRAHHSGRLSQGRMPADIVHGAPRP